MTPNQLRAKLKRLSFKTQLDAADALKTHPSQLCRWLNGKASIPRWVPLKIADMERKALAIKSNLDKEIVS